MSAQALPKIAIVGRPNVGKSSLFNRICQKRISIVDEREGITRDRLYARADLFGREFLLVDTGGIDSTGTVPFNEEIKQQALMAVEEADGIIFVVDAQVGPSVLDEQVAKILRKSGKPVVVAINKVDDVALEMELYRFHCLGLEEMVSVSAMRGFQVAELLEAVLSKLPEVKVEEVAQEEGIRVAIVGRPNVGKSTLLNEVLGIQRSIVSPIPGTTRDSIDASVEVDGKRYILVDTAGIRRKKAEKEVVDKFAAIRTEEAIAKAEVCLLVLDAEEGMTVQEKRIASEIERLGKSCIVLFNKWDLVKHVRMEHAKKLIEEQVPFLSHCPMIFLSALTGRNVEKIFPAIDEVYEQRYRRITTGQLNKFIEDCLQRYHPPLIWGKRLRIYYMAQVEVAPPRFVIFVNNPTLLVDTYKKYLINQFREHFGFSGSPINFDLRGKKREETPELKATHLKKKEPKSLLIDQISESL